ncbi:hypothetical protein I3843_12G007100 [Carya illinoinensis]|nr:hypothetical protein I3843_12G007100 [Carya illinoinensis]
MKKERQNATQPLSSPPSAWLCTGTSLPLTRLGTTLSPPRRMGKALSPPARLDIGFEFRSQQNEAFDDLLCFPTPPAVLCHALLSRIHSRLLSSGFDFNIGLSSWDGSSSPLLDVVSKPLYPGFSTQDWSFCWMIQSTQDSRGER